MLAIIAGIFALAGLGTLATANAAYAQGSNLAICYNNQCMNNWNAAGSIRFYGYNNGGIINNGWGQRLQGHVSNGAGGVIWPFTNGTGLNSRYNGRPVYAFGFNAAGHQTANQCLSSEAWNPSTETGQLETDGCSQYPVGSSMPDWFEFVLSSGGFLVPVYASNIEYTFYHRYNTPVFCGATGGGTADGQPVIMTVGAGQLGPWNISQFNLP
jgi:hypothetical protein